VHLAVIAAILILDIRGAVPAQTLIVTSPPDGSVLPGPAAEFVERDRTTGEKRNGRYTAVPKDWQIRSTGLQGRVKLDIVPPDNRVHRLALYARDETGTISQTVEVRAGGAGEMLDRRSMSNFSAGQYLIWDIRGQISIQISQIDGQNAAFGGIFLDLSTSKTLPGTEIPLRVSLSNMTGVAKVAYVIDGHTEAVATQAPWSAVLHASTRMDATSEIYAVAYDASGGVLASSPKSSFRIQLTGVQLSFSLPSGALSGDIPWTVSSNYMDPMVVMCSVDGRTSTTSTPDWLSSQTQVFFPAPWTFTLKTARFANGTHQLHCSQWHNNKAPRNPFWENNTTAPIASITRTVTFNNGNSPMELRSQWLDVFLVPGQTISLNPYLQNCDNSSTSLAASAVVYASADPSVATVSSAGLVSGIKPGVVTVKLSFGGLSGSVRVSVNPASSFHHLS
jgi:hypothetical protein